VPKLAKFARKNQGASLCKFQFIINRSSPKIFASNAPNRDYL